MRSLANTDMQLRLLTVLCGTFAIPTSGLVVAWLSFQVLQELSATFTSFTHLSITGDWRQTLPVVVDGFRSQIVNACLPTSDFWPEIYQLRLRTNMRVLNPNLLPTEKTAATEFADWLLQVGEDLIPSNDN